MSVTTKKYRWYTEMSYWRYVLIVLVSLAVGAVTINTIYNQENPNNNTVVTQTLP